MMTEMQRIRMIVLPHRLCNTLLVDAFNSIITTKCEHDHETPRSFHWELQRRHLKITGTDRRSSKIIEIPLVRGRHLTVNPSTNLERPLMSHANWSCTFYV